MLIRILLLVLPLVIYVMWLWRASHQLKKGKRKDPIPKSWQKIMLGLVIFTTLILGYLAFYFTQTQDATFEPYRPQDSVEQKVFRE